MAVAFDAPDRQRITEALVVAGAELFTTQGLRKTSLAELAAAAGIATSSFYAFFPAKEALYLELLLRRAPAHADRLAEAVAQRPVRAALVAVMRTTVDLLDGDPLYRRLLTHPEELAAVARRMGAEELRRVEPVLLGPLLEFVEGAQRAGELVAAPPMAVVGVLRMVGLVVLHRADHGAQYPHVLELTIQSLATGLVTTGSRP
ncbi:TetR/AcrR family transcriptional regulator [Pseudonocardia lacus]|uniref:TetR/AcrR family transcriptional regulator n=1 Tax=Pseudonocardia lacus TaxID=2835865 RepID=UPI001BDCDB91|nr:TetR/AcrR family transcriptional regulator [Pseudonocardia lacus]